MGKGTIKVSSIEFDGIGQSDGLSWTNFSQFFWENSQQTKKTSIKNDLEESMLFLSVFFGIWYLDNIYGEMILSIYLNLFPLSN